MRKYFGYSKTNSVSTRNIGVYKQIFWSRVKSSVRIVASSHKTNHHATTSNPQTKRFILFVPDGTCCFCLTGGQKVDDGCAWECVRRTTATMNIETTEYKIECRNLALSDVFYKTEHKLFLAYEDAVQTLRWFRRMFSWYQYRLVQIHINEHGSPTYTVLDV